MAKHNFFINGKYSDHEPTFITNPDGSKVVSWNIMWQCNGSNNGFGIVEDAHQYSFRMDQIVDFTSKMLTNGRADVALLQECPRINAYDLNKGLRAVLGSNKFAVSNLQSNELMAVYDTSKFEEVKLTANEQKKLDECISNFKAKTQGQRTNIALFPLKNKANGEINYYFNVHLDAGLNTDGVKELTAILNNIPDKKGNILIAGDFNKTITITGNVPQNTQSYKLVSLPNLNMANDYSVITGNDSAVKKGNSIELQKNDAAIFLSPAAQASYASQFPNISDQQHISNRNAVKGKQQSAPANIPQQADDVDSDLNDLSNKKKSKFNKKENKRVFGFGVATLVLGLLLVLGAFVVAGLTGGVGAFAMLVLGGAGVIAGATMVGVSKSRKAKNAKREAKAEQISQYQNHGNGHGQDKHFQNLIEGQGKGHKKQRQ